MFIYSKNSSFRWFIVCLLLFILIVNFIDRTAASFILDSISLEFRFSDLQLGFIMGSFNIGFLITALIGGIFLDKYGPKIILFLMGTSCLLSLWLMSISNEYWTFLLSRILLGIGQGAIFPAVTLTIKNWLSAKERTRCLGMLLSAANLGIILSGPIVSYLIYLFSWRGMFILLALLTIIWLIVWIYFFNNNPEASKFINPGELEYIRSKVDYINTCNKSFAAQKMPSCTLAKNKFFNFTTNIIIANIFSYCCFCFYFCFLISWLPSYFHRTFNVSVVTQGWIVTFIWTIATFYMFFGGLLLDFIYKKTNCFRYARSYPIIFSNLLTAVCIIIILFVNNISIYLTLALISVLVSCVMLTAPVYFVINIDILKKRIGLVLGIMEASASLAGMVAPIITGYITDITKSFNYIFIFLLLLAILSSMAVYISQCRNKIDPIRSSY